RDGGGRWVPGHSGNPLGRLPGSRNVITMLAQAVLDNDVEPLMQKAVSKALQGDPWALKLCIERIIAPQRQTRVCFEMPPLKTAEDAVNALAAIAAAAASGELAPGEARDLTGTVDAFVRALDAQEFERRLTALEASEAKYDGTK
ncbi:MAG TPA: DUF5681 domain-containing protein, partial [Stellaceae bacterium]|nr:DUF5681 domain-containing protein [Stellaceae bacterium]